MISDQHNQIVKQQNQLAEQQNQLAEKDSQLAERQNPLTNVIVSAIKGFSSLGATPEQIAAQLNIPISDVKKTIDEINKL